MLPLALILLLTPAQAWGSPSAEEFAIEDVHHKDWAPPTKQPRATPRLLRVVNGAASWYGPGFYGRQTASGERLRKGTSPQRTGPCPSAPGCASPTSTTTAAWWCGSMTEDHFGITG